MLRARGAGIAPRRIGLPKPVVEQPNRATRSRSRRTGQPIAQHLRADIQHRVGPFRPSVFL